MLDTWRIFSKVKLYNHAAIRAVLPTVLYNYETLWSRPHRILTAIWNTDNFFKMFAVQRWWFYYSFHRKLLTPLLLKRETTVVSWFSFPVMSEEVLYFCMEQHLVLERLIYCDCATQNMCSCFKLNSYEDFVVNQPVM